jgi:hypothetical protein
MKIAITILSFCCVVLFSCQNKTVNMLSKKWDYDRIENIDTVGNKFLSPEDSTNNANMQKAMSMLSWTFKKSMDYECAVNNKVTTQGAYKLTENDSTLTLIPSTQTNIRSYYIKSLTPYELVLSSVTNDGVVVMHFKAD